MLVKGRLLGFRHLNFFVIFGRDKDKLGKCFLSLLSHLKLILTTIIGAYFAAAIVPAKFYDSQ